MPIGAVSPLSTGIGQPGPIRRKLAVAPDDVRFSGVAFSGTSGERNVTVSSPYLNLLTDAKARQQAQQALQDMGRTLRDLTEFFYTERVREFNEAKATFQHLVARNLWGLEGYTPQQARQRPIPFRIRLNPADALEKRKLHSLDLSNVTLTAQGGQPVSLKGANLRKVNLSGFNTRTASLKGAEFDHETVLPAGLKPLGMKLVIRGPEKGPWMAYVRDWSEWPRSRFEGLQRWLAQRG